MKTFAKHFLAILLVLVLGAALGWFLGVTQYAKWTQQYANMEEPQSQNVLANVPLVKYEELFDFGSLTGKVGTLSHEFTITNTGRGLLKLSQPYVEDENLKCTISQTEIQPGESAKATLTVTPKEGETELEYFAVFETNVPSQPEIELTLTAAIYPKAWVLDEAVEIPGVPAISEFKTSTNIFGMDKDTPIELKNFRVTNPEYADFFEFETTEMYPYEFASVTPPPESGKIVTIKVKPGLPNKIFTVTVEGETNFADMPKIQFNIDFKAPANQLIPGASASGFVPFVPNENSSAQTPTPSAAEAQPEQTVPAAQDTGADSTPDSIDLGE